METMIARETELELINAELNDIFESSFDEIFVTDQHGVVIRVNSICEKNYRMSAEEIIGQHVEDLQKKGIFYPSATLQVIETKRPVELLQHTKYGRYLHVQARPVFDIEGNLKRVISYSRDLTELNRLSQKINEIEKELQVYKKEAREPVPIEGFITKSESMQNILTFVQKIAKVDSTVLILGETGVGKSKIVQKLHQLSDRSSQPLNEINCAALPDHLVESELFGYKAGSFTGALRGGKKGLIEASDKGILFLDEVAELPLHIQGKLLQVLQEKKIRPIGSEFTIPIDVRFIAATNKDLKKMVEEGTFRKDLFYRLNVIPIHIPPLRERKEDILPLVYHFIEYFNGLYNRDIKFSPKVLEAFLDYKWEGNIRELENMIERLVVTTDEVVTLKELPSYMKQNRVVSAGRSLPEILEEVERTVVLDAYEKYQSSYKVAEELGISQSAATRKIRKFLGN
jgi:PAS domain S-box-containing protein